MNMQLPFFGSKIRAKKNYFGLFLKEQEGIGMVIGVENGRMVVKEKELFSYSNGWDNLTEDVDELLFKLEQKFNVALDDTILFLYSHFIDEKTGDIKKPHIGKIKELIKNLELHALGYIECHQAVANYLESKEEMSLTAILLELDVTYLSLFIYKGGRVSFSKISPRGDNITDDLLNCFEELRGKFMLPARIILYNPKDLDDESTKILSHHWSEEYFVQIPRGEILREDEVIKGLISVFEEQIASQKGVPQQVQVLGFVVGEEVSPKPKKESVVAQKKLPDFALGVKTILENLKFSKKISFPQIELSKKFTIILGLAFIILSLLLNELFFHKASLTIFVPSQTISKALSVSASVNVATISADFSDSKVTTGKRSIGERARGEATVYNLDDRERLFKKETTIEKDGLKFVFDDEVKVASASISATNENVPGKTKVKISAIDIGPQYNISKNKRFKIDDLSPTIYYAINESDLTGGTKKEIQTVAKKDTDDLKASILEKAKKNPPISDKKSQREKIVSELTETTLQDLKFSKEVGEEAGMVSLQAKVENIYYSYDENALLDKLVSSLNKEVTKGFKLEKEKINYKVDSADKKGDTITLKITLETKAIKDVSKDEVISAIVGKNKQNLSTLLKNKFSIVGYQLNIDEPIPFLKNNLPFFKNNIFLKISSL